MEVELEASCLHARKIQQIVDESLQTLDGLGGIAMQVLLLGRARAARGRRLQPLDRAGDAPDRRPELVRGDGDELALEPIHLLELVNATRLLGEDRPLHRCGELVGERLQDVQLLRRARAVRRDGTDDHHA